MKNLFLILFLVFCLGCLDAAIDADGRIDIEGEANTDIDIDADADIEADTEVNLANETNIEAEASGNEANINVGQEGEAQENEPEQPESEPEVTVKNYILNAAGAQIGWLLAMTSNSYTFLTEEGYIGKITPETGYLYYVYDSVFYPNSNCSGTKYIMVENEDMGNSTKFVSRAAYNATKMIHAASGDAVPTTMRSYKYYSNSCANIDATIYFVQEIEEIEEAESGIRLSFETPIEIIVE